MRALGPVLGVVMAASHGSALSSIPHARGLRSDPPRPLRYTRSLASVSSFTWVIAEPWELHAQACARKGKKATSSVVDLLWDESIMGGIVSYLGYSSRGQQGCCVAGLWCDTTTGTCETHHFGRKFVNHGWIGGEDNLRPVFTCVDMIFNARPTVTGVTPRTGTTGTKITISGTNFGSKKSDVRVILGNRVKSTCDNIEFCHNICRECGGISGSGADTIKCGENEECIKDEPAGGRCLPYCDPQTKACPCSTMCMGVVRFPPCKFLPVASLTACVFMPCALFDPPLSSPALPQQPTRGDLPVLPARPVPQPADLCVDA